MKTRGLRIIPQYVHTYLQYLYTMVGCACPVELRMAKRVVVFFAYTAIRSSLFTRKNRWLVGLRVFTGRNAYVPAVLPRLIYTVVGCVCPVEWRMTKRVVFYFLNTTNSSIVINRCVNVPPAEGTWSSRTLEGTYITPLPVHLSRAH